MTQTPLQQAIEFWKQMAEKYPTLQLKGTADAVVDYLESLLPKEKEFAEKCFDAGAARIKMETDKYPDGFNRIISDKITLTKQQFINQLYPK